MKPEHESKKVETENRIIEIQKRTNLDRVAQSTSLFDRWNLNINHIRYLSELYPHYSNYKLDDFNLSLNASFQELENISQQSNKEL